MSVALKALVEAGAIKKICRGVYVKPAVFDAHIKRDLIAEAQVRVMQHRMLIAKQSRQNQKDPTAIYVRQLADREGITFAPTFADIWAKAVTK